jgi:hypothetical protein
MGHGVAARRLRRQEGRPVESGPRWFREVEVARDRDHEAMKHNRGDARPILAMGGGRRIPITGRETQGSSHAASGVCQKRQTTGFLRDAGSQKRRKRFPQRPRTDYSARCASPLACARGRPYERSPPLHGVVTAAPDGYAAPFALLDRERESNP